MVFLSMFKVEQVSFDYKQVASSCSSFGCLCPMAHVLCENPNKKALVWAQGWAQALVRKECRKTHVILCSTACGGSTNEAF